MEVPYNLEGAFNINTILEGAFFYLFYYYKTRGLTLTHKYFDAEAKIIFLTCLAVFRKREKRVSRGSNPRPPGHGSAVNNGKTMGHSLRAS